MWSIFTPALNIRLCADFGEQVKCSSMIGALSLASFWLQVELSMACKSEREAKALAKQKPAET